MSDFLYDSKDKRYTSNEILKRVQRLRNLIVESILNNNPFDADLICQRIDNPNLEFDRKQNVPLENPPNTPRPSKVNLLESSRTNDSQATKAPEVSLPLDLFCTCDICEAYSKECHKSKEENSSRNSKNSSLERPPLENPYAREITKKIQDNYRAKVTKYLKYIDCLKVTVHSLILNRDGIRKASNSQVNVKNNLPSSVQFTYFVEYQVPKVLINSIQSKSKTDSGLNPSVVRICSKRFDGEEIFFKQSHVYDVIKLDELDLKNVDLKFKISSRSPRQKSTNILGYSTFNFGLLEISKNLTSFQDLPVEGETPVDLGFLTITVQLGCGRLYFGKELIDALNNSSNKTHVVYDEGDESVKKSIPSNELKENEKSEKDCVEIKKKKPFKKDIEVKKPIEKKEENSKSPLREVNKKVVKSCASQTVDKSPKSEAKQKSPSKVQKFQLKEISSNEKKTLLVGFIYISEVQYLVSNPINSFLVCYPFGQDEQIYSKTVYRNVNPIFNFYQKIPYYLQEEFLISFRNNFMVIEFWEKNTEDSLIGVARIPLHQLFISYRNPDVIKQLLNNQFPVITADWWEPVYNDQDNSICGHVKVLVALGTDKQIYNLEVERGLKENSFFIRYNYLPQYHSYQCEKSYFSCNQPSQPVREYTVADKDISEQTCQRDKGFQKHENLQVKPTELQRVQTKSISEKDVQTDEIKTLEELKKGNIKPAEEVVCSVGTNTDLQKFDIGTQVIDTEMDAAKSHQRNKTQEMLGEFLTQLMEQKKKTCVENSTNTEEIRNRSPSKNTLKVENLEQLNNTYKNATNLHLRRTSDLLDSLQKALEVDDVKNAPASDLLEMNETNEKSFKAHVVIEEALHLPYKKKYKAKRNKRKNAVYEECLPSYYVTFEIGLNSNLKVTPIESKTTNPRWDFRCDVTLPSELLTNNQKRLIFKVWRKSGPSMQPNLHNDVVIGFAALDLSVLLVGLPSVQGWFNVMDFSGKCNGQIKISLAPLESLTRFLKQNTGPSHSSKMPSQTNFFQPLALPPVQFATEAPQEPTELFSNALKRKFEELEEINQRLRSRLADVIQEDSESNDEFSEAFECDINMLSVEDDFETVNFDKMKKQKGCEAGELLLQLDDKELMESTERSFGITFSKESKSEHTHPSLRETDMKSNGEKLVDRSREFNIETYSHSNRKEGNSCHTEDFLNSLTNNKQDVGIQTSGHLRSETSNNIDNNLIKHAERENTDHNAEYTYTQYSTERTDSTYVSVPDSLSSLDRQLMQGKQRVDNLLEKLNILTGKTYFQMPEISCCSSDTPFGSRYVSGCSASQGNDLLTVTNYETVKGTEYQPDFDPVMFQKLCNVSSGSSESSIVQRNSSDSCSTGRTEIGEPSFDNRPAPDGAGSSVEGKSIIASNVNLK